MECLIVNNTVQEIYCNYQDEYLSFIIFIFFIFSCICCCKFSKKKNSVEYQEIQYNEPPKYSDI